VGRSKPTFAEHWEETERKTMVEIRPLNPCHAVVTVPGSKSYTHRALFVSALADGESVLVNPLVSEDTQYTIQGLERFGVRVLGKGDDLRVLGNGGRLREGNVHISVGNSGTTMRFLTAFASLRRGSTVLDGSERMRQRPIIDLLRALETLGVEAQSQNGTGYPPVVVTSQGLKGGVANVRGEVSSQFLSGLLMAAPYAEKDVHLKVAGDLASRPYVDVTLRIMDAFGVDVERVAYHSFFIKAGQRYRAQAYLVEGDASHASYFFSAAALTQGRVRVENFSPASAQGDACFITVLERMGCDVIRGDRWAEVRGKELQGLEIDMKAMPDLVPTLAVTAAFARGKTVMKNIGHLRVKESDRIASLAQELSKMGIRTEEGEDWLSVEGGRGHGAEIETHEDHRLAMAFAMAGLAIPGIRIKGVRCVEKSFPDFWKTFQNLYKENTACLTPSEERASVTPNG
jgi:3-phosphoshikimate 1-carboxyvinyltransferase